MPKLVVEGSAMPGDLRRAMKASASKPKEDVHVMPKASNLVELTFREDAEGTYAILQGNRVTPSSYGSAVKPGETWTCGIDSSSHSNGWRFIAMDKVSDAPVVEASVQEPEQVSEPEPVSEAKKNPARTISPKADRNLREKVTGLKRENRELKERNTVLIKQNRELQSSVDDSDALKAQIKELNAQLEASKTEVKALQTKNAQAKIDSLNGIINTTQDKVDAKQFEIDMLRKKFREHGLDDTKAVPVMPNKVITCLTGQTGIQCSLLTKLRYNAYFSPRTRTIRFVPDEDGDIECKDGMVHMDGLLYYSNYQKTRMLDMEVDGECVVVTL